MKMLASQVMSRNVVTCRPRDSLQDAAAKMWDQDVGCLPVVDLEGHVIGIVTDRDVCMAAYTQGRSPDRIPVDVAMAERVHCCLATDAIETVEELMKTHRVRRIPVIDEQGHAVGIVSINDIVRESARELKKKARDVPTEDVVTTLASICQPRQGAAFAAE
jgi:CBS domain-containing protein